MIARGRLRALEGSLSPTEAVLYWLAQARTFPSLGEYAASTIEVPEAATPLERIIERVGRAARHEHRGEPRAALAAATRAALGKAVFRYELVLRLNSATIEQTERLGPRLRALNNLFEAPRAALPLERTGTVVGRPSIDRARLACSQQLDELVATVTVEDGARALLERTYLAGAATLFEDVAEAWRTQGDEIRLAAAAAAQPPLSGTGPRRNGRSTRPSSSSLARRAKERAGAIEVDARIAATTILGEHEQTAELLRSQLRRGADGVDPILAIGALERTSRPIRLASAGAAEEPVGVTSRAHPLDGLSDPEKARQLHLIASELEPLP
jgi:hypothetical protein